ncbi:thioesterase domain-containing protein [Actinoplanes sp. KI2]|uniref:thioesterase domain-containing protein n=1 Tax=Actinoplanes sp. KI2 TaxID=2983315 RepID=UPI0021D5DC6E|nr:thioesterase domain-containing protein [Actinoplanes sp. KI2]MCU7725986.1 thioesterase domain-containing protein [Actinoplanes sp. KI2]
MTIRTTDQDDRQRQLTVLFAETLGRAQLAADDDFFAAGGGPDDVRELLRRIRVELRTRLTEQTLAEHRTPRTLAAFLADDRPGPDPAVVLPLRRSGAQAPLFCIHPGSGFGLPYATLLPHLDPQLPVYALQARGLVRQERLAATLDDLADDYTAQILAVHPDGPHRLLGWCIGGRLAFEIACRLRAAGREVDLLTVVSSCPVAPDPLPEAEMILRQMLLPPGRDDLDAELNALCRLPIDYDRLHECLRRTSHPMARLNERAFAAIFDLYRHHERLSRTPVGRVYDGDLLCVTAESPGSAEATVVDQWRAVVGGRVAEYPLACRHTEVLEPVPAAGIAAAITAALSGPVERHVQERGAA